MSKPPADADPEKFVIGRGIYDSVGTVDSVFENGVFRFVPKPVPVLTIVVLNLIFVAFFAGFSYLLKVFGEKGPWVAYGVPIGVLVVTCLAFTLTMYFRFRRDLELGPWLVYDTRAKRVELPREHESFNRDEVLQLQYITTKRLDLGGMADNDRVSELNLITYRDSIRLRWPVLRSAANVRAFDRLLELLVANTDLPVVRVTDGRQWRFSLRTLLIATALVAVGLGLIIWLL